MMSDKKDPKPTRAAKAGYQVLEPDDFSFESLKDETADPVDPELPSSAEIAEQLGNVAEDIKQPPLTDEREDATIIPKMNDDTTGLVTVAQAAEYLERIPSHVREMYHAGRIAGTSVGSNWLMLDSDSVKLYKSQLVDGRFLPDGYMYRIDLSELEVTIELLQQIMDQATKVIRMEIRLREEGVEALQELGLDVQRSVRPEWGKKKDRSPLAVPEEFQKLLKQARRTSK
jgi:hypothetical protein